MAQVDLVEALEGEGYREEKRAYTQAATMGA